MAFLIVHRAAAGWINSTNDVFDTEAAARAAIPALADLYGWHESRFRITESRMASHQLPRHLP